MRWSVELRGHITRDIRWVEIEANSVEAAKAKARLRYGANYMIQALSEIQRT